MGKSGITFKENGMNVDFRIHEDGVVELADFSAVENSKPVELSGPTGFPIVEVQVTGETSTKMHGYKHNACSASMQLKYRNHRVYENSAGKKLEIELLSDQGLAVQYNMQFYNGVAIAQVWNVLQNCGKESMGIEYASSFIYQGLAKNGEKLYFDKTDIYIPYNGWDSEARWKKADIEDLNLTRMPVEGPMVPGFGNNRFSYGSNGSWSTCEYLPMGFTRDRETNEIYYFQIENSGEWLAEYGSGVDRHLYIALSGPSENENGWWKNLKPGDCFATVKAAFGVIPGNESEAAAELTKYRRKMRRTNEDDEKCNVVFNDYMNCLMGDPTEEKELRIIDKAAELGCEYYCLDCGWYDDGDWWDSVGAWKESRTRFPNGLKKVFDYAKSKGLKMGLWLEIETMGIRCELANALPDDWFFCRHGKRHVDNKRYLLDFRNQEVREYCMDVIDRMVRDYGAEYFKMDYNVTTGIGSDVNSDSCADALLEHNRCLYQWYEDIYRKYPGLVIENCGSGGQRMDYGMLRLQSLQSTSDQTDYIFNSHIAANVSTAVTPEQAGMWVYPYEDEEEHVIYNMVNGMLLRPYISGMVWKLSANHLELLKEGIDVYKGIRSDVKDFVPYFPLGLSEIKDETLAYGLKGENKAYLSVFLPGTDQAEIPLEFGKQIREVKVLYPKKVNCKFELNGEKLKVQMPQKKAARFFEITF